MRLFYADDYRLCALKGDQAIDITEVVKDLPHVRPEDLMSQLIGSFAEYREKIESVLARSSGPAVHTVRTRAPLPRPRNIVCMARNYMESGALAEPDPINAFHKARSEEHTSELQSLMRISYAVFCLKKKRHQLN